MFIGNLRPAFASCIAATCVLLSVTRLSAADLKITNELRIAGTNFELNGAHFPYTGVSFFNAIFNPAFNKSSEERLKWLNKFHKYGINVLRIWGQWDSRRGYADTCDTCTLYFPDGRLRGERVETLKQILVDADKLGIIVEFAMFARESWHANIRLTPEAMDKAVESLARELLPYRNVTFQIWNEFSERVLESVAIIRRIDPKRLVTNSPGFAGNLGDARQNEALDYLTPHTSRQGAGRHWEIAPKEIAGLIERYKKPVVDDEPARTGTRNFGGPNQATSPFDHILHIHEMWNFGAYITYHHDMFQTGYGTPAVPDHGIPDPEFSPYHRQVFEFIAQRKRYEKK